MAPKRRAESTLQVQSLPYFTVRGSEMTKLSSSLTRLKQMGGPHLGYYNTSTGTHLDMCMLDKFINIPIIRDAILKCTVYDAFTMLQSKKINVCSVLSLFHKKLTKYSSYILSNKTDNCTFSFSRQSLFPNVA